jgi:hypothetical protein
MKSTKMPQTEQSAAHETQKLEVRYGSIGISAVAAAMQCRGPAKEAAGRAKAQSGEKAKELADELA